MKKRIGILGGMSPESTIEYYRLIIHEYVQRFGDHDYPEILIYSVSFGPFINWQKENRWELMADSLRQAALHLQDAGADFLIIATNTMHLVLEDLKKALQIPVLSILDVVGDALEEKQIKRVGLLGTQFTMDSRLYPDVLSKRGIEVLVPSAMEDMAIINSIIYNELIQGVIREESRVEYQRIINQLAADGAEGIILGCTEIPLLIKEEHVQLPLFDTTRLHASATLDFAMSAS